MEDLCKSLINRRRKTIAAGWDRPKNKENDQWSDESFLRSLKRYAKRALQAGRLPKLK
jgi:hypothetical protein